MKEPDKVLTQAQFYRWQYAQSLLTTAHLHRKIKQKELEIARLEAQHLLDRYQIKQTELKYDQSLEDIKKEFNKQIDAIESEAGFSIRGMSINEDTLEVLSDEEIKKNL